MKGFGGQVMIAPVPLTIRPATANSECFSRKPTAWAAERFVPANCHS
jgi:hypothetical protein